MEESHPSKTGRGQTHDPNKNYISKEEALGIEQMFKLERPAFVVGAGIASMVKVTSHDGKWTAELPMTTIMWDFFGEKTKIYVMAIPDRNIGLHITHFVTDYQDW